MSMQPGMGGGEEMGRSPESAEQLEHGPAPVTIYLLRHGLTGKDKQNPNREITEVGQQQVKDAMIGVIDQLIHEADPAVVITDENRATLFAPIAKGIEFRMYDSGTSRTQQQVTIERDMLKQFGATDESIYVPATVQAYEQQPITGGPGVQRHLEGVKGLDENKTFRKEVLDDPATQERLGTEGALATWLALSSEEIPDGVEKPTEMTERMLETVRRVQGIIPGLARRASGPDGKRLVIIGNSHGSFSTLSASTLLGADLKTIGEVKEAEGFRLQFNADGSQRSAEAFGKQLEAKLAPKTPEA